jgi:hypothetical protein
MRVGCNGCARVTGASIDPWEGEREAKTDLEKKIAFSHAF